MQNLIIATIAIVLGVAMAGIATFYGGQAFLGNQTDAEAVRLFADSEQVAGAVWQWRGDTLRDMPPGVSDPNSYAIRADFLVASEHLSQIPQSDWLADSMRGGGALSAWAVTPNYIVAPLGDLGAAPGVANYGVEVCVAARANRGYSVPASIPEKADGESAAAYYARLVSAGAVRSCGSGDYATDVASFGAAAVAEDLEPCCVCTFGGGLPDSSDNPICDQPS